MSNRLWKNLLRVVLALCICRQAVAQKSIGIDNWTPALIPMRSERVKTLLNPFKRNTVVEFPLPAKWELRASGVGHLECVFEASDQTVFFMDMNTGDFHVTYRNPHLAAVESSDARAEMPLSELTRKAAILRDRFYPTAARLNQLKVIKSQPSTSMEQTDGTFKSFDSVFTYKFYFSEKDVNKISTLNECLVELRRDTGDLTRYKSNWRAMDVMGKNMLSQEETVEIARWYCARQSDFKYRILPLSEMKPEELKIIGVEKGKLVKPDEERVLEEDTWLHQRIVCRVRLNVGVVEIDANYGRLLSIEPNAYATSKAFAQMFAVPTQVQPTPATLPPSETKSEVAHINFCGDDISEGPQMLHYPPIIRDNSALIFSEYFPKFLISVAQKGDVITLQGGLKDKGKSATLKIGDKKATVDGNEVVLASAPVVIDKRLYLPAELMQSVNGIPIRWEAKNKLLYVETRYLWR